MATKDTEYLSSNRGLYFSIFLLLIIIGVTFWLNNQNTKVLENQTTTLKNEITQLKDENKNIKKDDMTGVLSLLQSNPDFIKIKNKMSDITVLINRIETIGNDHGIGFESFSYKDGKINMKVKAIKDFSDLSPKEKVVNFLSDFRLGVDEDGKPKDKKINDFDLGFVKKFSSKDGIQFDITLKINTFEYIDENFGENAKNKATNKISKIKEDIKKIEENIDNQDNNEVEQEQKKSNEDAKQAILEKIKARNAKKQK